MPEFVIESNENKFYKIKISGNKCLYIHINHINKETEETYNEKYKDIIINFKKLKFQKECKDKDFSEIKKLLEKRKDILKLEEDKKDLKLFIMLPKPYSLTIEEIFKLLNIEYYITFGPKFEKRNEEHFFTSLNCDKFNINNLKQIFENDKILEQYNIDSIRYFDKKLKGFKIINTSTNVEMPDDVLILELHCNNLIDPIKSEFERNYDNIMNQIKKLNKTFELEEKNTEYDMVYLYASPIINGGDLIESQINYRKDIKNIVRIFKKSEKKLNCLFECANEKTFRDLFIMKNKIKILHIASHGQLDDNYIDTEKNYNLILENNARLQKIKYHQLEKILMSHSSYLKKIDLVILATCHSEEFGLLFEKFGVNNVIYITKATPISDLAALKFSEYFYSELIKCNTIKNSFDKAIEKLKIDREVELENKKMNCSKGHCHRKGELCQLSRTEITNILHEKEQKCNCDYHEYNLHKINCQFYKEIKEKLNNKEKEQSYYKEEDSKWGKICCCDYNIEHCEHLKFKLHSKIDKILFQNNEKGTLKLNPNCTLFDFDYYKSLTIFVRAQSLGDIYNIITEKQIHFIIVYGSKEVEKQDFVEASCVYLLERKIISNYKKIELNTKIDLEYALTEKSNKNEILIIKISYSLNENDSFSYLAKLLSEINLDDNNNLNYIIILATEKESEDDNIEYLKKNFTIEPKNKYKFIDVKLDKNAAKQLLKKWCEFLGYSKQFNKLFEVEIIELLERIKCHPKKIRNLADLIGKGYNYEELKTKVKEINNEEIFYEDINEKLIKKNKIYFLLSNMPFGIPESLIKLIYPDYGKFLDKKNIINDLIYKDMYDNSYYVKEVKNEINTFEDKDKEDCISRCLIVYSKLLYYYLEKNRQNICHPDGNIHYLFNSYNGTGIWKTFDIEMFRYCFYYESSDKIEYDKILNDEFKLDRHMNNIINLMINNIGIIKEIIKQDELKKECLEQILILLPSMYFLEKDCKIITEKCKFLSEKLELKNSYKRLLIFSSSLDIDTKINLEEFKEDSEDDLKTEAEFLDSLKKRDHKILKEMLKKINNKIIGSTLVGFTNYNDLFLKKCYIYYEIASLESENGNLEEAMESLSTAKEIAIEIENYFLVDRFNIDLFLLKQKYLESPQLSQKKKQLSQDEKQQKIEETFNLLNEVLHQKPYNNNNKKLKSYLVNEAYKLKIEFSKISEPDIIILSSNPLTNYYGIISNGIFTYQNNQYYLLEKLNKRIKIDIKIESNVLNKNNLNKALNREGEILIIQADDFSEKGEIILETNEGESEILSNEDLESFLPVKIKYKVVILCFINSGKLRKYFEDKTQYLITFDYIDWFKYNSEILFKYNQLSIDFLIDFIEKTTDSSEKKVNNIEFSFEKANELFMKGLKDYKINENYISLSNKNGLKDYIKYKKTKIQEKIILNQPLLKLGENNPRCKDFSDEILQLIKIIISGKEQFITVYLTKESKLFEKGSTKLNKKSRISFELMKFFYRHQTFKKIYYINNPKTYGTNLNNILYNFFKKCRQNVNSSQQGSKFSTLVVVNYKKKEEEEEPINLLNDVQYLIMAKKKLKFNDINYERNEYNQIFIDNNYFKNYEYSLKEEISTSKKSKKQNLSEYIEENPNILEDFESIFKNSFESDKDLKCESDSLSSD